MLVTPGLVLLLLVVAASPTPEVDGAEDNVASVDRYDQDLEHHEIMQLVDVLRAKKPKCKTLKACTKAKGKCSKKKDCDGKIVKVKKGCSKGCDCCVPNPKPPKCSALKPCTNAGGECTKKKDCEGEVKMIKGGCSTTKDCVCCIPKPPTTAAPPTTMPPQTSATMQPGSTGSPGGNLEVLDCGNGRQVPGFWKCDGFDDCGDGSDEANCDSCAKGDVKCSNGKCIREAWKCDGYEDCDDASDEKDCNLLPQTGGTNTVAPRTCTGFQCKNSRCIISSYKCDGWDDCGDKSDESSCSTCSSSQFKCKSDGKCIRADYKCDGYKDCDDNSDETDCKTKCKSDQFQCAKSGKCISNSGKCDGYNDCTDKSDEKDCKKCDSKTQFECKNKNCIANSKKCDGKNDCGDGSDEENCATSCQCGVVNTQRIVGGKEVSPKRKYPWQIGLQKPGYYIMCGGSIINNRWILTAAHCIVDHKKCAVKYDSSSTLKVVVGEHKQHDKTDDVSDTKSYSIKTYIKHPNYNCKNLDYDFALLEVTEPIPFNKVIRPICLPKDDSKTYVGQTATVTGWGKVSTDGGLSKFLQEVQVPILANDKCGSFKTKPPVKMCAGGEVGKDSCGGDSGGPLHVVENNKYVQVGVVSYGSSAGCAKTEYPGVYARVSKVLSWITTNTASGKKCD